MRRLAVLLLIVSGVAACDDNAREAEAEKLVKINGDAWVAAGRSVTLAERIAHLKRATAALDDLEKRFASSRAAKDAVPYPRGQLAEAERAAGTCAAPPYRACLLAEAEKRIKRDTNDEAAQLAILLRAAGEARFVDRFKAVLEGDRSLFRARGIPADLVAAKADALLDVFIKGVSARKFDDDALAIAQFFKKDRDGYAATLEKMRVEGRLDDIKAAEIAEETRDPALFAEALKKAIAFDPAYAGLRMSAVLVSMAQADMADEVRAVAARKEPPLAGSDFRVAALAMVAGARREMERLEELERSVRGEGRDIARTPFLYWGLALGWARAGRIEEAAAHFRAELTARQAPDVLAAIALVHARAGRAREAIDVLLALDLGNTDDRTAVIRAFAEVAEALR